jgi:hypothetical protein
VLTLPFDLVERNRIIEAVARFKENVDLRFGGCSFGSFGEVAAAIWLEERKSENEDPVCWTGRVAWPAVVVVVGEVKASRGLPASEPGGLSMRASAPQS